MKKLVEWDLKDGDKPVPISAGAIVRLQPHLYARLVAIVSGMEPTDTDETRRQSLEDESQSIADLVEAHEKRKPLGLVTAERDQKN